MRWITNVYEDPILTTGTVNDEIIKLKEQRGEAGVPDCEYPSMVPPVSG